MSIVSENEYDQAQYCLFAFVLLSAAMLTVMAGMAYYVGQLVA
jgi:hypothetical protein